MYIAIDTSTDNSSLAVIAESRIIGESTWKCRQNHTVQLLPALSSTLERVGATIGEAKGIVVARGPGSYNGLRVGLSTAKGLAFSLNIPLVGISSLEVEAYQQSGRGLPVCAIFNAGRGDIATATYVRRGEEWIRLDAERITTPGALCSTITATTVFCGEYVAAIRADIASRLGDKAVFVSSAEGLRRAGYLAELGLRRLANRDYDDPATLQPLYLRAPAITVPKDRT